MRFPSITSMSSSAVASQLILTSALAIRYSPRIAATPRSSRCVSSFIDVEKLRPPFSFFFTVIAGGRLLRRIPTPSSSFSITRLWPSGFIESRTMMTCWHVRAVEMTCRPRPLPSFAPSMIPGRSSSWIRAPRW